MRTIRPAPILSRLVLLGGIIPVCLLGHRAEAQDAVPTTTAAGEPPAADLLPGTPPTDAAPQPADEPWQVWSLIDNESQGRLAPPGLGISSLATPVFTPTSRLAPAGEADRPMLSTAPPASPVSWGPVDLHASLAYQLLYGSGILANPGDSQSTMVQSITPSLALDLGRHWRLEYVPTIQIYSSSGYQNTVNQLVSLQGWATLESWRFSGGYSFSSTDDPLVETGTQTEQTIHNFNFGAFNQLRDRLSYELNITETFRFAEQFNDTYSTLVNNWVDYRWRPRMTIGVGVGVGYDIVDPGTDMPNQSVSARVLGSLATKLAYELQFGLKFTQFRQSDEDMNVSPLVNLSVVYTPLDTTSVSVFGSHDVGVSYYSFQFSTTTTTGVSLRQRLFKGVYFNLAAGYQWVTYQSTLTANLPDRNDDYYYVRPSLSTRIFRRIDASVFFQYSENKSNQPGYSYDSPQVGFNLAAGF